jgi:hypothetical protein
VHSTVDGRCSSLNGVVIARIEQHRPLHAAAGFMGPVACHPISGISNPKSTAGSFIQHKCSKGIRRRLCNGFVTSS